jgi:hypothetical protein
MRRRKFITLLGGAVIRGRWRRGRSNRSPCGGSACSRAKRTHLPEFEAFRKQLQDLAYVEGKNLAIDWRYAERGPTSCPSSRSNSSTCIPTSSFRSQRRRRPRSRRRQAIVSLESHRWDPKILPHPGVDFIPATCSPPYPIGLHGEGVAFKRAANALHRARIDLEHDLRHPLLQEEVRS